MVALTCNHSPLKDEAEESYVWDQPELNTETFILIFLFKSKYLSNCQVLLITSSKCPGCSHHHLDYRHYLVTNEGCLSLLPRMSVLWSTEFLNSQIHFENKRLIRNQKQNNRDVLIYSASSSRIIDPSTMSVIEGIPEWSHIPTNLSPESADQVVGSRQHRSSKDPWSPYFPSPWLIYIMTIAEPKVQFPQSLFPFPNKENPPSCCTSQSWSQRSSIITGERERRAKEEEKDTWLSSGLLYSYCLH